MRAVDCRLRQRLEEACALSAQLDEPDVDDFYITLEAARQTVDCCRSFVYGDHPGDGYVDEILADVLADVQRCVLDSLGLLRIAADRLSEVAEKDDYYWGMVNALRMQASMLAQVVSGESTLAVRVVDALRNFPEPKEAALMALVHATECLADALAASGSFDGPEVDEFWELLAASHSVVDQFRGAV